MSYPRVGMRILLEDQKKRKGRDIQGGKERLLPKSILYGESRRREGGRKGNKGGQGKQITSKAK